MWSKSMLLLANILLTITHPIERIWGTTVDGSTVDKNGSHKKQGVGGKEKGYEFEKKQRGY